MATAPSLFGATPEALQQQRNAALNEEALQYAKLDPFQRATMGIYKGANQLGGAIGGMLGGQDPQLQKATALKQLASQFDTTTPQGLQQYARGAAQLGFNDIAMQASQAAQEGLQRAATLSKTDAEALRASREKEGADPIQQLLRANVFTPGSIATYQKSKNIGDLVSKDPKLTTQVVETLGGQILINKETGQEIANIGKSPVRGTTIKNDLTKTSDIIGAVKDFDESVKPFQETQVSAVRGKSFLDETRKGNSVAFEQARTTLAKAVGEGKLSNEDVKRAGIDPRLVAGALDWLNKKIVGVPNEDIIKQMYTLFDIMEKEATKNIDAKATRMREIAQAQEFKGNLQTYFPTSTGARGSSSSSEEEDYKAYVRKREQGGR